MINPSSARAATAYSPSGCGSECGFDYRRPHQRVVSENGKSPSFAHLGELLPASKRS
jgi:hypothetical protein